MSPAFTLTLIGVAIIFVCCAVVGFGNIKGRCKWRIINSITIIGGAMAVIGALLI